LNILSFDIEDWFHIFDSAYCNKPEKWKTLPSSVEKNTSWTLDFLEENKLRATFFCLGWVAEKHPSLIKKISDLGHEVAAHSYLHNKVYESDPQTFRKDTERVIKNLQDITGKSIDTYRAPGFSLNKNTLWAFEILHELGIKIDSSLKSNLHMGFPGRIPSEPFLLKHNGYSIKEFPIRTFNFLGDHIVYSGSGYFRLWPYWFVKNRFKTSHYEMVYFHPRDFDSSIHKMFNGNPYLQLRYRVGTSRSRKKMKYFVSDFDFLTIHEADKKIDWDTSQVVNLQNGQ
jgi:peptidoglycan-N-acetylglucosamine deacetylase